MSKLKQIRIRKQMTLRKLAEKSGVSYSSISKIERGLRSRPSYDVLQKISTALNVSIKSLLTDSD